MKKALALTGFFVTVGFIIISVLVNFISINLDSLLAFFNKLGYIVTYISLLVCLTTVIVTLLWYPHVRKKFSSPIRHSGLSVVKLLLGTTILIVIVQICLVLLYPNFLYQISFYLFFVSLIMFTIRNLVTLGGAHLHKRREKKDSDSSSPDRTPLVTVIVPAYN